MKLISFKVFKEEEESNCKLKLVVIFVIHSSNSKLRSQEHKCLLFEYKKYAELINFIKTIVGDEKDILTYQSGINGHQTNFSNQFL